MLLGPAGEAKDYTIPVRFAVERDDLVVYSEKFDLPVSYRRRRADRRNSSRWSSDVEIPFVGGENTVIWVGFDTKG